MQHHCYIIPYSETNNNIYVLIGRKKTYNRKDGYIQNNPGQFVFIGGGCRSNLPDDRIINAAFRELREETGNVLRKTEDMKLVKKRKYSFVMYKIKNTEEYKHLSSINENADQKYVELREVRWVPLTKAIELMSNKTHKNDICDGKIDMCVKNYTNDWASKKWRVNMNKMKPYFEKEMRTRLQPKHFWNIIDDLYLKTQNSEYYGILYRYWLKKFQDKGYTDWYLEMVETLKKEIGKQSPPKFRRPSPPKKKSPPKFRRPSPPKQNRFRRPSPPKQDRFRRPSPPKQNNSRFQDW
jgi:8-oxo-dGTP pyrophosphatase MutT (NUDIX family)